MLLINILLVVFGDTDSKGISEINSLKKEAQEAYQSGSYQKSAYTYSYLVDTLNIADEKAIMNLANSYYKLEDTENALSTYQRLGDSNDKHLKSQAYQQMGVLSKDPKTLEKALAFFKESIKSDPTNNDARYNYELVKKKLQEQEKQDENQQDQDKQDKDQNKDQEKQENKDEKNQEKSENQDKDQEQKEQENEENKDQEQKDQESKEGEKSEEEKEQEKQEQQKKEGEEGEENEEQKKPQQQEGEEQENKDQEQKSPQQSTAEKLEEMNISEEKAKMILEALKNSEIQYIQQNRRKPTKRKDSNKPDW